MRTRLVGAGVAGLAGIVAMAVYGYGCGSNGDCTDTSTCGGSDDGGGGDGDAYVKMDGRGDTGGGDVIQNDSGDGGGGGDGDAAMCDPMGPPSMNPCAVDSQYGLFVAPKANGGDDGNGHDGSKTKPFATINHALMNLGSKKRVFVCDGTFNESVAVNVIVGIYGGLTCPTGNANDWTYMAGTSAQVNGPQNGFAVTVTNVTNGSVDIEDVTFIAPDAMGQDGTGNGLSSVAGFVSGSSDVTLRRCSFTAGKGDNGNAGGLTPNYGQTNAPDGMVNKITKGGPGGTISCVDNSTSAGGNGGDSLGDAGAGGADGSAMPMPMTGGGYDGIGGAGGTVSCGVGDPGANGAVGTPGTAAAVLGDLTAAAWTPSVGSDGQSGQPGQGGGGGGAKAVAGGTGGGCGGCGGAGGGGGKGGGASIALASLSSTLTLDMSSFKTGQAGSGGNGHDAEAGQGGGGPGVAAVCIGGYGGNGAGGCGGAGGTAGISVCLVYKGGTVNGSPNCTKGAAGTPGTHGKGAGGGDNNPSQGHPGAACGNGADGLSGVSQDTLQLQ
jgi:hypothetical protein